MRKILESVCVGMLGALFLATALALYGPNSLPSRIPTHVDITGNPDAWSSTFSLQALPFVALVLYIFLFLLARYQSLASYPVQTTAESQPRLEELALGMLAWIKAEMVAIFLYVELILIHAARHPEQQMSLLGVWLLFGAVFVTIAVHAAKMVRAGRSGRERPDSHEVSSHP